MAVTYHATLLEAVQQYVHSEALAASFLAAAVRRQAETCIRLHVPSAQARSMLANDMNVHELLTAALFSWQPVGIELRLRDTSQGVECAKVTLFDRSRWDASAALACASGLP